MASGDGSQADVGPGTSYPHPCLEDPNDPWGPLIIIPPEPDLSCLTVPAHNHGASLNSKDHLKCVRRCRCHTCEWCKLQADAAVQTTLLAEHSRPTLPELAGQHCGAYEEESPFVCLKDLSFWVVRVLTNLSLCFHIKSQIIIMMQCRFVSTKRQAGQKA